MKSHTVTLPDSSQQTLPLAYATKIPTHVVATQHATAGWQIVKYAFSKQMGEEIVRAVKNPKMFGVFSQQMRDTAILLPVNA